MNSALENRPPNRNSMAGRISGAIVLTLILLGLAVVGVRQQWKWSNPTDQVVWVKTSNGLRAARVPAKSPAWKAGLRAGDWLVAIGEQPVWRQRQLTHAWYAAGVGGWLRYALVHKGKLRQAWVWLTALPRHRLRYSYEELIGLLYLVIGLFVLLRRSSAHKALHFYWFCLASFVLYSFHYTGKLNGFDWILYWGNLAATLLAPALLLHFACSFPRRKGMLERLPELAALLYAPALLLGLWQMALATGHWGAQARTLAWSNRLDYGYLGIYFLLATGVFWHSYRHAVQTALRQQMKWITRGMLIATVPFVLLYVAPYALGWPRVSGVWAIAGLVLIPITFANAIIRYRLMDTDVLFRRGLAYTLATLIVLGADFAVVGLVAALVRTRLPHSGSLGLVLAIVLAALLFEPIKNRIQGRLTAWFDPRRYDYREALAELARQTSAEHDQEKLIEGVLEQLGRTLQLERVALFLPGPAESTGWKLVGSRGFSGPPPAPLDFLDRLPAAGLFFENPRAAGPTPAWLDLHYYLPCQSRGQTLAVLGLGHTQTGDYLSSGDVDLVRTLTGHLAVALENAGLHERLRAKARQFEQLKEFNENIVESVRVGIVALNLQDQVESWNAQMEVLSARPRATALGRRIEQVLGPEFAAAYYQERPETGLRWLEKFPLRLENQPERIFNIAIAPLVTPQRERVGRILLLDDISQRMELESQLAQAERLRSVGLLAAGVAHEVNTPLAVISNYTQLLAKQMPAGDARGKLLDTITAQTFRASEIVGNLLQFSRTRGAAREAVDLYQILRDSLALLEHPLREAHIQVELQCEAVLPRVRGNAGQLQQVVLNLLLNARDAMPSGGRLVMASWAADALVSLSITDSGSGIAPEIRERIFEPFFTTKRAQRHGHGVGSGTGLGLAVSYGIMQDHGGRIRVENVAGMGARFIMELPVMETLAYA